jgi:glycosyltransferase involved in cell wall biosynthesis
MSDSVLFVGRFTEEKGVLDLVQSWGRARVEGLRLTMIGSGPLLDVIRASGSPGIDLPGQIPPFEVRRLMLEARALVLPSRWFEGMPMVLLEAMAAGLPVVVPAHGDLVDTAGPGGVEFKPLDVDSLAKSLGTLSDDTRVDVLGASSRSEYSSRFPLTESAATLGS